MGEQRFVHAGGFFAIAAFAAAVFSLAFASGQWALAIYGLSVWHYVVYALAFSCRDIGLQRFKADAIVLKAMAVVIMAVLYIQSWPADLAGFVSLVIIAAGFGLNMAAARAIGSDRTYYGYELTDMPAQWSSAFPYSCIAHPMLAGNMLAFAGTLLNSGFRQSYWPLAVLHVGLNFLILVMELRGRRSRLLGLALTCGGLAAGAMALWIFLAAGLTFTIAMIITVAMFAAYLARRYTGSFAGNQQHRLEGKPS